MLKRWAAWLRDNRRAAGCAAAVMATLTIAWVLFVPTADWLATHDVGPVTGHLRTLRLQTARDAARGRLLTLGAGLFAAGALLFTARNFTLSRRTVELTLRAVQLSEEGQVTDRYTKAIEQLGSDKLDVRIGSIYALQRVARDSVRDHPSVMEVLSAFVREHSREPWPPADDKSGSEAPKRMIRPDIQAAITVIGRRDPRHDLQPLDLVDTILPHADLKGLCLTDVYLNRADLTEANCERTDFTRAVLIEARLVSANLCGGIFAHALLHAADLTGAKLSGAKLTVAALDKANLTNAILVGSPMSVSRREVMKTIRPDLTDAELDVDVADADLTGAFFLNASLTGALWPPNAEVPKGWQRDTSGRLGRA